MGSHTRWHGIAITMLEYRGYFSREDLLDPMKALTFSNGPKSSFLTTNGEPLKQRIEANIGLSLSGRIILSFATPMHPTIPCRVAWWGPLCHFINSLLNLSALNI